jgi:arylformamidase
MEKIVDLTLPIYSGAPTMPLDPKCAVIVHHTLDSMRYNITQLIVSTHHGTHVDAPYHFFDNGRTIDKLDLHKCIGQAHIIDLSGIGPRYVITPKDMQLHRDKIIQGSRIIIRTDWWKKYPKKEYFFDGPMVSPELARWFAKIGIFMLGVETPGVNPEKWEEVHKILLKKEIVIIEGLAYLNKLKGNSVYFIAAPLKIRGRDGSPARAVAIEEKGKTQR